MPKAIVDELRYRVLGAWQAGEGSLRELADRFQVGYAWARKIREQQLRTGLVGRVPQARRGFPSRVDEETRARLRAWVGEQPDRTELELRDMLRRECQIEVCHSRVGQLLRGLGLRRKKNPARQRAR